MKALFGTVRVRRAVARRNVSAAICARQEQQEIKCLA
jgi:hypothetical protein